MSLTTRVGLLAGASALTLTGASFADNPTEAQNYEARIAELEATVAQLKGDNWLTEQRSDEIRSMVQDALADADTRASLLQAGMTAGYDNGFVIGSSDGNFMLKINGQLQTRFVYNNQDKSPSTVNEDASLGDLLAASWAAETEEELMAALEDELLISGDDNRWGFENTRTKLIFSGHVVNPDWMYLIEANFGTCGTFTLEDAYIAYNYGNGWKAMMGQFKAPFLREELVNSMYQLAVERSWVNEYFTAGRTQGVAMDYLGEQFHFTGALLQDGANADNGAWINYDVEWAMGARVEVLFQGTWDQFTDFTSWKGEETGFMMGAALHYQSQEYGTSHNNELEVAQATIDASVEFGGANLFGAIVYSNLDNDANIDADQYGIVIQGGFFLDDNWELFGRYEWSDLDMQFADDISIFTVGVNRYWAKHGLKWTTDIGYGIESVYSTQAITGWRADGIDEDLNNEDGQVVFRTQMQLTF
jgi:hypothetical protein